MAKYLYRKRYLFSPLLGVLIGLTSFFATDSAIIANHLTYDVTSNKYYVFAIPAFCAFIETLAVISFYIPGLATGVIYLSLIKLDLMNSTTVVFGAGCGAALGYGFTVCLAQGFGGFVECAVRPSILQYIEKSSRRFGVIAEIILSMHPNQMALLLVFYASRRQGLTFRAYIIAVIAVMILTTLLTGTLGGSDRVVRQGAGYVPLIVAMLSGIWLIIETIACIKTARISS